MLSLCFNPDSVFSERYMQMPWSTDNYEGYEKADVTRKAAHIKDKKLLLIHGTADGEISFPFQIYAIKILSLNILIIVYFI